VFAGDTPTLVGLLHMLQTWKLGASGNNATFLAKLAAIPAHHLV
jgi:hypothetical protein